jgi:hypothetical protein
MSNAIGFILAVLFLIALIQHIFAAISVFFKSCFTFLTGLLSSLAAGFAQVSLYSALCLAVCGAAFYIFFLISSKKERKFICTYKDKKEKNYMPWYIKWHYSLKKASPFQHKSCGSGVNQKEFHFKNLITSLLWHKDRLSYVLFQKYGPNALDEPIYSIFEMTNKIICEYEKNYSFSVQNYSRFPIELKELSKKIRDCKKKISSEKTDIRDNKILETALDITNKRIANIKKNIKKVDLFEITLCTAIDRIKIITSSCADLSKQESSQDFHLFLEQKACEALENIGDFQNSLTETDPHYVEPHYVEPHSVQSHSAESHSVKPHCINQEEL